MNVVILTGNVTRDPEVRTVGNDKVASFGLAVNRPYKKNDHPVADFFDIDVWGNQADYVGNYVKKGSRLCVNGSIEISTSEKDGQTRRFTKIRVGVGGRVEIMDKRDDNGAGSATPAAKPAKAAAPVAPASEDPF